MSYSHYEHKIKDNKLRQQIKRQVMSKSIQYSPNNSSKIEHSKIVSNFKNIKEQNHDQINHSKSYRQSSPYRSDIKNKLQMIEIIDDNNDYSKYQYNLPQTKEEIDQTLFSFRTQQSKVKVPIQQKNRHIKTEKSLLMSNENIDNEQSYDFPMSYKNESNKNGKQPINKRNEKTYNVIDSNTSILNKKHKDQSSKNLISATSISNLSKKQKLKQKYDGQSFRYIPLKQNNPLSLTSIKSMKEIKINRQNHYKRILNRIKYSFCMMGDIEHAKTSTDTSNIQKRQKWLYDRYNKELSLRKALLLDIQSKIYPKSNKWI